MAEQAEKNDPKYDPMLIDPPASRPDRGTAVWTVAVVLFVTSIYQWDAIKAFFNH